MDLKKGISVIIPVFNAEKYIEKCITSLVNQTFKDLELIFVIDKNSSDKSEEIIDNFAKKNKNIKVIKPTENNSVGYNRNIGIENVEREYIGFVDADDYISENFYELLFEKAVHYDADIAMSETVIIDFDGDIYEKFSCANNIYYNIDEIYSFMKYSTVWNKIYRTSLIKPNKIVRFPENIKNEDNVFTLKVMLETNKLVNVANAIYYWKRNPNSITTTSMNDKNKYLYDAYYAFDEILDILYTSDISTETKHLIVNHNVRNYAGYVLKNSKYKNYFIEKLKMLIGQQNTYKILYELSHPKQSDLKGST